MKRKNLAVVALIFSLLFFFGAVAGLIVASTVEKISEKNTTEYTATVINAKTEKSETSEYGEIYTEEYGTKLLVPLSKELVDKDDFTNIQAGQTIFFRIDNVWVEQFEQVDFIYIFSLKTAEKELLSLGSYAEYREHRNFWVRVVDIIVIPIFLLISIHCILLLKGINVFRRQKIV